MYYSADGRPNPVTRKALLNETGVEELDQEKLPHLLQLKYKAIEDAKEILVSSHNELK